MCRYSLNLFSVRFPSKQLSYISSNKNWPPDLTRSWWRLPPRGTTWHPKRSISPAPVRAHRPSRPKPKRKRPKVGASAPCSVPWTPRFNIVQIFPSVLVFLSRSRTGREKVPHQAESGQAGPIGGDLLAEAEGATRETCRKGRPGS